jgi:CRP/FNR family transcriptional regulator
MELTTNITIFNKLPTRKYNKGQLLLFQGEVPRFGFILKRGVIKEYDINKQGNEQITWLVNKFEVFPFPWLMNANPTVSYYYETVTDCEVYILRKEEYFQLLTTNKEFLYAELKRQATKENEQTRRLAAVLNFKAENKLVNTFHYLIECYGDVISSKIIKLDISLTHQDLADLTGLTRETVSKEIGSLKKKGIISQLEDRSKYTFDLNNLNELLSTPLSSPDLIK